MSATPILDLDQAPPEPSLAWLPKLIGLLLGLVVGAILILADRDQLPQWHWPPFNALLFVPALYVAIAFHEIGHFVAGKLVGLEAGGISVGAFVFTKSGKNWVFRFDWRMWTCGFFKPLTGTVDFHPSRYAWFVAGGPACVYWAHLTMRPDLCSIWEWRLGLDRFLILDFAIHRDFLGDPILSGLEQV